MTATPHVGSKRIFSFLALLDVDRFEGRYRDGVHAVEPNDLMRSIVEEELLIIDGLPGVAAVSGASRHTVHYRLSDAEEEPYETVTQYVREEMNREENLEKAQAILSGSLSRCCSTG